MIDPSDVEQPPAPGWGRRVGSDGEVGAVDTAVDDRGIRKPPGRVLLGPAPRAPADEAERPGGAEVGERGRDARRPAGDAAETRAADEQPGPRVEPRPVVEPVVAHRVQQRDPAL